MTQPEFIPLMPLIKIDKREDGLLDVRTNTHLVTGVSPDDLRYVVYPYAGCALDIQLICDDNELKKKISEELDKASDFHVYFQPKLPIAENVFFNYSYIYHRKDKFKSLLSLRKALDGKNVLFVGAGESTNLNLEWIRKRIEEKNLIVIAGGSANRILSENNIYPNFALTIDPKETEYSEVFAHLSKEYFSKVPFIINQTLYSPCLFNIQRAYCGVSSGFTDLNEHMEPEEVILPEGRTGVSTMIPWLADYMGVDKLYYIGVDLCYSDEGKVYTHSKEATKHSDYVEDEGLATRLMWQREAADIERASYQVDCEMLNISNRSLLKHKDNLPSISPSEVKLNSQKPLIIVPKDKVSSVEEIKHKLKKIQAELELITPDDLQQGKIGKDNNAFRCLLYTYHVLQQFREVRTGEYNKSLLHLVLENLRRFIKEGL